MRPKVCFLGGMRYSRPLNATQEKKWRMLSEAGELFVIGFSQDIRPRRFTEHAYFYLLPKWPLPVLRYLTMFTIGPLLALWIMFRHGVDTLVAQSPYEGFAAALAKKVANWLGRRIALIVENHGDFEVSLFLQRQVQLPSLYRTLMRLTAKFALYHADLLRAVSSSTKEQLKKWASGKPIERFPTWTDIEAFLAAGGRVDKCKPEIVYAGVLIPRKGVHHLINAFSRVAPEFPEARLVIIGRPENPEYANSLRKQVTQMGLDKQAEFIDELPQVELAQRIAQGMVFVLPTYSEGLPRVVFESMAVGLPVIATCVSGIPDVLENGVTGFLISPGDEDALADRLRWVLAHPEEAKRMGKQARAFAQKFFSVASYLDGYRRLFEEAQKICNSGKETEDATASF